MDMAQTRKKRTVTDSHKEAMAAGRTQSRMVATYLEAIDSYKPKRGRKRTSESIDRRLSALEQQMTNASPVKRLSLMQERSNLISEKSTIGSHADISTYEEDFVKAAKEYGERKGIRYSTWRELGVPAAVLKKANISRSGR